MQGGRWPVRGLTAVFAVVALAGCGTSLADLNFRVDDRLHFVSPEVRSTVRPPVAIAWQMDDFRIAGQGSEPPSRGVGYFAIFVDQKTVKPGHTLADVAEGDTLCEGAPNCPNETYLANHGVYTTTNQSFEIPQIPNLPGSKEELQLHAVTIVLMDTAGRRIGESAWEIALRIKKVGF
ncbi:hypothetical protein [Actinocrispum wychmicini]|uniref:Lipoprotein n=1 Tax=Actinocrispum wychmicini TaxID=1213861 RepID=A0A4R2JL73_9PSEU|nr:hypothetical protein [Actinocrispum wychmicini]TCO59607.1 hypothetical protein EV192_104450 [Actinocrispum wychmicini]